MSKPDDQYKPRPWYCDRCKWLLGFVVRDSKRVRRLNVLRVARDPAKELVRVQIFTGELSNLAYYSALGVNSCENIPCGHCGCANPWEIGEDAFAELLERRGTRTFGLEVNCG